MAEREYSPEEVRWHMIKMMRAGKLYAANDFVEQLGFTMRQVSNNMVRLAQMGLVESVPSETYSRTKAYRLKPKKGPAEP